MYALSRVTALGLCVLAVAISGPVRAGTSGTFTPQYLLGVSQANRTGLVGSALAVSGDTLVIGAPNIDITGGGNDANNAGRVISCRLLDGIWGNPGCQLISAPIAFRQVDAHFGAAVAIIGDTLMVGAPDEDVGAAVDSGAVYFYQRDAIGIWQFFSRSDSLIVQGGQRFGASVALTTHYAAAGSPSYDQGSQNQDTGRVTFFVPGSGSYLVDGGALTPTPQGGEAFGTSLHIQDFQFDTDRLFIGAPNRTVGGFVYSGSAFYYERLAGDWTFQQSISPAIAVGDFVGSALSTSGDYLFVGARGRDRTGGPTAAGSIRVYLRNGSGVYAFDDELFAEDAQNAAFFGSSLAVSGGRLVVGAPFHNTVAANSGRAYIFDRQTVGGDTFWMQSATLGSADPEVANEELGSAVAVFGGYAFAGIPKRTVMGFAGAGVVQVYKNEGIFSDSFEILQ